MFQISNLSDFLRANLPLISLQCPASTENTVTPETVIKAVMEVNRISNANFQVFTWDLHRGLKAITLHEYEGIAFNDCDLFIDPTDPVIGIINTIEMYQGSAVFVLYDITRYLGGDREDPTLVRAVNNLGTFLKRTNKRVIFVSQYFKVPDSLSGLMYELSIELPKTEELREIYDFCVRDLEKAFERKRSTFKVELEGEELDRLIRAAQGLTAVEFHDGLKLSVIKSKKLDANTTDLIQEIKYCKLRRLNVNFSPPPEVPIQGLDNLNSWLNNKSRLYTKEAQLHNLTPPKGVMLVGPPGSGKSLCAKTISTKWGIPSLSVDVGTLFGSLVGESEKNLRELLATADAIAPCILNLEELDKAFAGMATAGGDSGTSRRMFGHFLTWMTDHTSAVFVVASANSVDGLPPELLRKGRFDEVFYVGLPNKNDRKSILSTHLLKYTLNNVTVSDEDLETVVALTKDFSGAELASIVREAANNCFAENRPGQILLRDLVREAESTVPLVKQNPQLFERLFDWAKGARHATNPDHEEFYTSSSLVV
jgi:MoxR-like ATPase